MRTVAIVGNGVVGRRIEQRLPLVLPDARILEIDPRVSDRGIDDSDIVVLASPAPHAPLAERLVANGTHVVSVSDDMNDVSDLLQLDDRAHSSGSTLLVGAGMAPGLSGLLARHLADQLSVCDEIHIAMHGTAGPACARQHHDALSGTGIGLHDGDWIRRPSGSGRELCWFPEPVGAYDCYRAELASPLLLRDVFPGVGRISARMSATRRDRFTAWLPMLRPPHPEGGVGALRVEVRGANADGERVALVVGLAEQVGTTAAATAAAFVPAVAASHVPTGVVRAGDPRLDTLALLHGVERLGVRIQEFTGIPTASGVEV
ncbi:MAG: hypothetical protein AAGA42_01990 [Actinomycetota bacterium]